MSTTPPKGLCKRARDLYHASISECQTPARLALLVSTVEALDRSVKAGQQIAREGATTRTAAGTVKPHPAIRIERESRAQFLKGMKALGLDSERTETITGIGPVITAENRARYLREQFIPELGVTIEQPTQEWFDDATKQRDRP